MYKRIGKRLCDILFAISALAVLAPILGFLVLIVWAKLGSPVFFVQKRPGLNGKLFALFKFRTMTYARNSNGRLLDDADRLTSVGRILRLTSLDELPELINVLYGEMSLVGPRPLLARYIPFFTNEERLRFSVRPGITGLAQISGRNDLSWDMRLARDLEYVRRCSLLLDLQIIIITFWRILTRKGLRVDPGASMSDFDEERQQAGKSFTGNAT